MPARLMAQMPRCAQEPLCASPEDSVHQTSNSLRLGIELFALIVHLLPKESRLGPMRKAIIVTRWAILLTGATIAGPSLPRTFRCPACLSTARRVRI